MEKVPLLASPKTNKKVNSKSNPAALLANLSQSPATKLADNFNSVQKESTVLLNIQKSELTEQLPKIKEGEGSAFSSSQKNKYNGSVNKIPKKPQNYVVKGPVKGSNQKETKFPDKAPLKKVTYNFQSVRQADAKIDKQAQNQLDAVSLNTAVIPTKMQVSGKLDLSGEADINNLSKEQDQTSHEVNAQKVVASKDIVKDFGENDIINKPGNGILKTSHKLKTTNVKINSIRSFKLDGIDEGAIDANFAPVIQEKIGAESANYEVAQQDHDQKVLEEETNAEAKIENEKDKSQSKQLKSVKDAQSDVNKSRTEWHAELNKTETDFAKKSGEQAKTTMGSIKTQKTTGESNAQTHINKANDDARKEKENADREAEEKKSEKKKESGGFFGWLADKASALINALKDALNFIFTKLRQAVKAIFDLAKKLVLAALELARKAIVGLIKGFATLLKGFLDIALVAFPAIRDRLKAKIDNFVVKAEKLVNQAFDVFKKAVTAIIDFLASAVDALLGALQAVYNFILDVVNFIVAGILKIMQGLANLVMGAIGMPDNFMGQISEEFLGMDVTQPLPFEKSAAAETKSFTEPSNSEFSDLLTKNSYQEDDFHVDPVTDNLELSPELLAQLDSNREFNFGENGNTIDSFKGDVGTTSSDETADAALPTQEKPEVPDDPYAQADWFIKYQNSQSKPDVSADNANGKEAATAASMPEDMKLVGPWSPGVRLYYLKEQMMAGISKKWEENKVKYITIGSLIVLGITALAIATAGAIFGLIPPALEIFAAFMMGAALLKATGFFKDYMTEGWVGNIATAAKALARAIGIILVELIFILLFDSAALLKVLKTASKSGVKGVFNLAKTGVKSTLKAGKNALVATGKGFVKQAGKVKFFVLGIGKGVVKGAKNLDELGESLIKRFKFKGFKIVVKGFKFYLYGSVNPWVLLASGDVEFVEDADVIKKGQVRGDITFLKNGQEITGKLITNSTVLPKGAYRRIFEMFTGQTAKGKVIHHMIEQQMIGFVAEITEAFVNNAKRLKGIPQGMANDVVHLSNIRTMWDDMYRALREGITDGMTNEQAVKSLINFAEYTDEFIEASFKYSETMGSNLTKDGLHKFAENWLNANPVKAAVKASIKK